MSAHNHIAVKVSSADLTSASHFDSPFRIHRTTVTINLAFSVNRAATPLSAIITIGTYDFLGRQMDGPILWLIHATGVRW